MALQPTIAADFQAFRAAQERELHELAEAQAAGAPHRAQAEQLRRERDDAITKLRAQAEAAVAALVASYEPRIVAAEQNAAQAEHAARAHLHAERQQAAAARARAAQVAAAHAQAAPLAVLAQEARARGLSLDDYLAQLAPR